MKVAARGAVLLASMGSACLLGAAETAAARELRVGLAGSAPFAVQNGDSFGGISVEHWKELAAQENLDYTILPQRNIKTSLQAVREGMLDVAIGPISITPDRIKDDNVDFTQPYFISRIGILVPEKDPSLWSRLKPFFGVAALSSVGILVGSLFIVGNLIWLAERHRNSEQFPRHYLHGVANGMWFALVTLTTVGYGDRSPVTLLGRSIAGLWMVVTLVAVTSITAGLASAFTVSLAEISGERFSSPSDLRGASVAVVEGTTSVTLAKRYLARWQAEPTLAKAIERLSAGAVEGVIFDEPALRYHLQQQPDSGLKIAGLRLATEPYGIALQEGDPLMKRLDVAVVRMDRNGRTEEIVEQWFDTALQGSAPELPSLPGPSEP